MGSTAPLFHSVQETQGKPVSPDAEGTGIAAAPLSFTVLTVTPLLFAGMNVTSEVRIYLMEGSLSLFIAL